MSGLKPIGSEKLEGMDKLRRIMEIARFNENIPQSVNETAKSEYRISLADGNTYEIVREKLGYIIKSTINESESDYIEPIRERKYFSSYSQALKRLNLMAKELNTLHENKEGISLIGEQKKKFILKTKKKKTAEPASEIPPAVEPSPAPSAPPPVDAEMGAGAPPPVDAEMGVGAPPPVDAEMGAGAPPPVDAEMGSEMPPMGDEMGGEEPSPVDAEMGSEMPPMDDETPPVDDVDQPDDEMDEPEMGKEKNKGLSDFKRIQILVGKLAQKIRTYEDSEDLSAKDVKYIINSILSAINVEVLDEDDIEQIISKLEGTEEDDSDLSAEDDFSSEDEEDVDSTEMKTPDEEMGESYETYGEAFNDYLGSTYAKLMSDDLFEDDEYGIDDTDKTFQNFSKEREKTPSSFSLNRMMKEPYFEKTEEDMNLRRKLRQRPTNSFYHLDHGTFSESKIDKVLSKYYSVNENEITQKYSTIVENDFQMKSVKKFLIENPNSIFMGKTTKGNMVFKKNNDEVKITKSGTIL